MSMFGGNTGEESTAFPRAGQGAPEGGPDTMTPGASPLVGLGADGGGGGGPTSSLRSGVLVLALVVVVAGGALFMMRKFGLGAGLQFVNINIDYPVDAKAIVKDARHLQILDDLKSSDRVVQVPLTALQRNPFELGVADKIPTKAEESLTPEERIQREREERERQVRITFSALRLNAVLTGSIPVARISGQPYMIGEVVGGVFTVKAIHGRSVDLEANGELYTLKIGE